MTHHLYVENSLGLIPDGRWFFLFRKYPWLKPVEVERLDYDKTPFHQFMRMILENSDAFPIDCHINKCNGVYHTYQVLIEFNDIKFIVKKCMCYWLIITSFNLTLWIIGFAPLNSSFCMICLVVWAGFHMAHKRIATKMLYLPLNIIQLDLYCVQYNWEYFTELCGWQKRYSFQLYNLHKVRVHLYQCW